MEEFSSLMLTLQLQVCLTLFVYRKSERIKYDSGINTNKIVLWSVNWTIPWNAPHLSYSLLYTMFESKPCLTRDRTCLFLAIFPFLYRFIYFHIGFWSFGTKESKQKGNSNGRHMKYYCLIYQCFSYQNPSCTWTNSSICVLFFFSYEFKHQCAWFIIHLFNRHLRL